MAVTLAQAAALEPSPLRRGTMQMFSQVSTVFDRLPLESINGAAYAYSKDKVLPGTAFRTVNEAYVESTGLVNQDTESLVILGGEAHVDTFIERTMDSTPELLLAGQTRMKVESLQATFVDSMFNGDTTVDPKGFDGLRKRLVGAQVIDSSAPTNSEGFLDELDRLRSEQQRVLALDDGGHRHAALSNRVVRGSPALDLLREVRRLQLVRLLLREHVPEIDSRALMVGAVTT